MEDKNQIIGKKLWIVKSRRKRLGNKLRKKEKQSKQSVLKYMNSVKEMDFLPQQGESLPCNQNFPKILRIVLQGGKYLHKLISNLFRHKNIS